MQMLYIMADAITNHHDPNEIVAYATLGAALITLIGTLGKLALNKFDKFSKVMMDSQEKQAIRLEEAHRKHIEMMQDSHGAQIETLTGIIIDNQRAMTALTVQLDRYSREMHEMTQAINNCPGVVHHWQPQIQPLPQIPANHEH